MKKNFLITADIKDTWELDENNFLLGNWCEPDLFGKEKLDEKFQKEISTIKNTHHYLHSEKKINDYEYIKNKLEYLLETISEKLSIIHKVDENKEYWRTIFVSIFKIRKFSENRKFSFSSWVPP